MNGGERKCVMLLGDTKQCIYVQLIGIYSALLGLASNILTVCVLLTSD